MRSDIQLGQATRQGATRPTNADRIAYHEPADELLFHRFGRVLAIADGSRSLVSQPLAADLAVQSVCARFESGQPRDPIPLLSAAVTDAHRVIAAHASSQEDLRGLSASVCAAVLRGDRVHVTSVGDVHAWRIRSGEVECLTEGSDPAAALGMDAELDVALRTTDIRPRDVLLFATDGFHRSQQISGVLKAIRSIPDTKRVCQHMMRELDQSAPPDDATLAIIRIQRVRGSRTDESPIDTRSPRG